MEKFATADLCDDNQDKNIQVLAPNFKNYGGKKVFSGQVKTLKLNKSNWGLIDILKDTKTSGIGIVLVIDVDKADYGVVGDKLSLLAEKAGYEGMIINGYVRDTYETVNFNIGLIALGTCPLRNFEKTDSSKGIDLEFGSVNFTENSFVYCDNDGTIVCKEALI